MGRDCAQRQPVKRVLSSMARKKQSVAPAAEAKTGRFRSALLTWYDTNRRDLPWRGTHDPYAIWLSEIMLQQTRVAAALGHYPLFLERFPNIVVLAAASEDDVVAAWSGLGYYRRARMMHRCAREVVELHGGRFPANAEGLRTLPGIGRYTAAAIASIAFQEPVAVVDGNVERVLRRLAGRTLTLPQTWERAQELVEPSRPGDFNQAMMELGATVCLPGEPRCLICPVRQWCATKGQIREAKPETRQQHKEVWCALERRNGQVRLVRRPKTASLMAGMWELPQWAELPHDLARSAHWRTFRHSITVTDYTVHVVRDWVRKGPAQPTRGKWVAIDEIPALPITGLTRKILKAGDII
jgi:A/G-specific adenine glycosylase